MRWDRIATWLGVVMFGIGAWVAIGLIVQRASQWFGWVR